MQLQQIYNKDNFLEQIDQFRVITSQKIDEDRKSEFSQYFIPAEIARFMASLFVKRESVIMSSELDSSLLIFRRNLYFQS